MATRFGATETIEFPSDAVLRKLTKDDCKKDNAFVIHWSNNDVYFAAEDPVQQEHWIIEFIKRGVTLETSTLVVPKKEKGSTFFKSSKKEKKEEKKDDKKEEKKEEKPKDDRVNIISKFLSI